MLKLHSPIDIVPSDSLQLSELDRNYFRTLFRTRSVRFYQASDRTQTFLLNLGSYIVYLVIYKGNGPSIPVFKQTHKLPMGSVIPLQIFTGSTRCLSHVH